MPAMCYDSKHGSISDIDIDSKIKEREFLTRVKELCNFFKEPFDPAKLVRYLPYWETDDKVATYVQQFDWTTNKEQSKANKKTHKAIEGKDEPKFTVTYQQQFVKCGKPNCSKCTQGQGHGPYWYAYWREGSRVRKRYLGKKFKALWELPEFKD